jgi:hypothetical protein
MSLIREYKIKDYEITEYTTGGNVRDVFGKIIASWTNYWTSNNKRHQKTQEQINKIQDDLQIFIN